MKRFLSILFVAIFLLSASSSFALKESGMDLTCEGKIEDYFGHVNCENWDALADFYCEASKNIYNRYNGNISNHERCIGIFSIDSVDIVGITSIEKDRIPFFFEIEEYYEIPDALRCYEVEVKLSLRADSDYYHNGVNTFTIAFVWENEDWFIGGIAVNRNDTKGQRTGLINFSAIPSTITVMDENGYIETVDFDDYIFNVTCNEIGDLGFDEDALKANVMAVKMIGWFAQKAHCYGDKGYDIGYGMVTYLSTNRATQAGRAAVQEAMNEVANYCMVSSEATGGKLFTSNYAKGKYGYYASHASSGVLKQYGSNYLAEEMNYDWKEILHFYYDNATYNYPNLGIVQIRCISHTYGTYTHDEDFHWRVCTICGQSTEKEAHHWTTVGTVKKCSICGRRYPVVYDKYPNGINSIAY